MALSYTLDNIADYKDVCYLWQHPDPMTEAYRTAAQAIKDGWDASRVREGDDGVLLSKLNPITNVLIMSTMSVGIPRLGENVLAEFYARFTVLQALDGGYVLKPEGKYDITFEDIAAHVGLSTNAKPMTRSQWVTVNLTKGRLEELHRHGVHKLEQSKKEKG